MYGIFVAMIVMNCTLASRGKLAIYRTASATSLTSILGSTIVDPLAWRIPVAIASLSALTALPMSIWPQAISQARPSSEIDFVSPVTACLVDVYGAELGRGTWADI